MIHTLAGAPAIVALLTLPTTPELSINVIPAPAVARGDDEG